MLGVEFTQARLGSDPAAIPENRLNLLLHVEIVLLLVAKEAEDGGCFPLLGDDGPETHLDAAKVVGLDGGDGDGEQILNRRVAIGNGRPLAAGDHAKAAADFLDE